MELNLLTCPVGKQETLLDSSVENPFDLDINLPEYYPDVRRILKCTVRPNIHTVSVGTDRVTAEGNGVFRMLYVAEDGQIASYEQTFPLSRSAPFSGDAPSVCVGAAAHTEFVNGRATGQRRVGVHGVVSIQFTATGLRNTQIVTDAEQSCLQVRTKPLEVFTLSALAIRSFAMSEVVELGEQNPPVERILRAQAVVQQSSVKAVKDKLLIKGDVTTEILYAPQEGDWVTFRHVMPLSQIVEAQGIAEDNLHDVSLRVLSLEVTPKADGAGDVRLLEIALRLQAQLRSGTTLKTQAVWDAYSTEGLIHPQYGDVELLRYGEQIQQTIPVRCSVDPEIADNAQLLDVYALQVRTEPTVEGETLVLHCTAQLGILCRDAQGDASYAEKEAVFSYSKDLAQDGQAVSFEPVVQIIGCKGMLGADGKIDVRMEALVSGTVYLRSTEHLLLSAVLEQEDDLPKAALTIYFADAGESVWDIARRYRTTVSAVLEENGLESETVPQSRMLVIPVS